MKLCRTLREAQSEHTLVLVVKLYVQWQLQCNGNCA